MNAAINPTVLNNESANHFEQLAAINVSGHIEKKNGMSYLSWAWAVDKLMRIDPQANWAFRDPMYFPDGSMMVHCDVTVFGKTMYMFLPVMDHRNKAILKPNAFDINKAMMRCLVKGIAVHAKQRVMQSNELIKDAHISLLKNQASARKNAFEAMEEFI